MEVGEVDETNVLQIAGGGGGSLSTLWILWLKALLKSLCLKSKDENP
jgi:hypothetical protein